MPPQITSRFIFQALTHPEWTLATLKAGLPRLKTMEKYATSQEMSELATFVGQKIGGTLSWDYLKEVRDEWPAPLILKGILHPDDAEKAVQIGVDGILVSNHGARQFDGYPAAIDALPAIVKQVKGKTSTFFESGVRSGLDIIRDLSLGADFILLGRPFLYGVAALGLYGGDYTCELLMADLKNKMIQLGYSTVEQIKSREGQDA
jgi:L-lactate dehydrogenase (cytochrome)